MTMNPRWGRGPWDEEPDRVEFRHAGMPCLLKRSNSGAWCGYVGLPPTHPLWNRDYNVADELVHVHGGITYGSQCQGEICHVPLPGEPEHVFWLGFDCAHGGDLVPDFHRSLQSHFRGHSDDTYRDLAYVRAETENLADQLAQLQDLTP